MSKSIASKTLAIAKRQEAERLNAVKEGFLEIIRKKFERPWTAVGTTSYIYKKEETFPDFNFSDLKVVAEDLGFKIRCEGEEIYISIPEWVKGQKRTQAQLMLYWSNIEIKRKIKSRKELTGKMCKEALEKLKNGDFVTTGKWGNAYEISVKMNCSDSNKAFKEEAERILKKRNILLLHIDPENGEWKFRIMDN